MTRFAAPLLTALLLVSTGCSSSRPTAESQADRTAAATSQPIRVLAVSATHGFRHGPAIERSREVFRGISDTTEIQFDVTEDVSDLNADHLSGYDVLMFNNSTLRMAGRDIPWRVYELTLDFGQGTRSATVTFTGEPGDLGGTIEWEDGDEAEELESVELDGDQLTVGFPGPDDQTITVEATVTGGTWESTVAVQGNEYSFDGELVTSRAEQASQDEGLQPEQLAAVQEFVRSGKGVAVAHAGLDALYESEWYRTMVGGGLFDSHPWTEAVYVDVEEPQNPTVRHWGDAFAFRDEIYVLDENPRWTSNVTMSLDTRDVGIVQGPASEEANDYPLSWLRRHEGGRVFVTALGHFAEVWSNSDYQRHLTQGIRVAAGRVDADFTGHREKEVIADGVWPDDIAVDQQGDVWIAELRGKLHHYDSETGETRLMTTIPTTDPTGIEHGLYGVEIDPNFYDGEPYLYLFYAEQNTFINTLSRFEVDPETAEIDESSEKVILRVPTEPQCCHQAGDLEWGPDGKLWISTGDTGYSGVRPSWEISEESIEAFVSRYDLTGYHWSRLVDSERTSQNLADPRGKILRINKDGSIPKDNPFYGEPGKRWDVWAYGLRNPYRFKVDENRDVYIGVVGPDAEYDYDEYNLSTEGGENYGWPRTVGTLFYNEWSPNMIENYTPPIWEYTYEFGARSATVGPVYRSDAEYAFPEKFQDRVFVYDWSRGWIKYGRIASGYFTNDQESDMNDPPQEVGIRTPRLVDIRTFDMLESTSPISMEMGPDGSIYVAEFTGFWDSAPGSKVTRYRWIDGDEGQMAGDGTGADAGTSESAGDRSGE